ncbi:hypothetical protein CKAH01_05363 [Colletotrichum kahawae]|uniref:Uncharacterized protein n=1 Tax=Colletotrichum kahawae TaxID=34407 RepID=A0AAE0D6W7_COLKA|nr:hypothetical protein CKAH01_05363 [Colletotrichum kahawae]
MQEKQAQGLDPTESSDKRTSLTELGERVTKLEIEAEAYQEAIKKQDLRIGDAFNLLQDPSSGNPRPETPSIIVKSPAKPWTTSLWHLWDLYSERGALRAKLMKVTEDRKAEERSVQALKSLTINKVTKTTETATGDFAATLASALDDLALQSATVPKTKEAQKKPSDFKQEGNRISRTSCRDVGKPEEKVHQTTGPSSEKRRAGKYSVRIVEDNEPWKIYGYRGDNFYDHYDRIRAIARKR